jgi:hypothetical protein
MSDSICVQCGAPMEPERRGGRSGVAGPGGLIVGFSETEIIPAQCSECGERIPTE